MKVLRISSEKELKKIVNSNRKAITQINNVKFGEMYPLVEVTNRYASYYDVDTQTDQLLKAPFTVHLK